MLPSGQPWKSAGFHDKRHGSWHFHGEYHGCGTHGTCRGSFRGKLRRTNHGNPRKLPWQFPWVSAAIATAVFADVQPKQFPRPSAAVRGNCHGNPLIRGDCHGSPRLLPQHVPRFCRWPTPSYQPCPRQSVARQYGSGVGLGFGLGLGLVPWC